MQAQFYHPQQHNTSSSRSQWFTVAKNLGRVGQAIVSLRTLRRMSTILDVWLSINTTKSAKWDNELYHDPDTKLKEEVNKLITEGAGNHDINCKEVRKHPEVFKDKLKGNAIKMEPVSVKFKPDAVKPKIADTARQPSIH